MLDGRGRREGAFARANTGAHFNWFTGQLLSGRTVVIRSHEDIPPEEAAAAEYYRRVGIRSQLLVPLLVGGRVVATVGFGAFHSTRRPTMGISRQGPRLIEDQFFRFHCQLENIDQSII
jgi:GAF domain-containing protein